MGMTITSIDEGWEIYNSGTWYYILGNYDDGYDDVHGRHVHVC